MACRTKIICTIGPAVNTYDKICALIKAGMNVARLNFSHGSYEEHFSVIEMLKRARKELQVPLAILLDTSGPEVRVGKIQDGEIKVNKGERLRLLDKEVLGGNGVISVNPPGILKGLSVGAQVLFDDGYISSRVKEVAEEWVELEIENYGVLKGGKGVNIPNVSLNLPSVTEKDVKDIEFGCRNGIDWIAVSFVRTPENIITVKNLLESNRCSHVLVIAKIENHEGIEHFDSILQISDGVMIARGDLGVEIPLSHVPRLQKEMIRKCYLAGKPSVTATQMLESMINNPRPTRAEVSDVANAIYDSTSAVMLSGETAIGKYPIEAVEMMRDIISEAETDFDYRSLFELHSSISYNDVPSSVTLATVKTAYSSGAKAIFAFTSGGGTARLLSRLRPELPIVAMTPKENFYHQLSLNWGVIPFLGKESKTFEEGFEQVSQFALKNHILSYGDLAIATAGSTFGIKGTTNMMIVEHIGDVLVRGHLGEGEKVYGNVKFLRSPSEGLQPYHVRGALIVITKCDESYLPYIQESAGVILQNHIDDEASEMFAIEQAGLFHKPTIVRADAAAYILKEGQLVTLDPGKALIYKGVVI
ncbi:pyruvate kinase [Waddlia chondrophila 2032/99]|nr:pyruvate kinase [Waddlia chondrophila]CCB91659.1 pyruvate kinase [Waddlia chondrophila 2032/99]